MSKNAKKPSNYLAPLAIAGITVGVLYKAYRAIFKPKRAPVAYLPEPEQTTQKPEDSNPDTSTTEATLDTGSKDLK
ncbi:MAG: hypothetical protein QM666_01340 [Acinetobacter sp.]